MNEPELRDWHIGQGLPCGCHIRADKSRQVIDVQACTEAHAKLIWMHLDEWLAGGEMLDGLLKEASSLVAQCCGCITESASDLNDRILAVIGEKEWA